MKKNVLIVSVSLPIAVNFALCSKTQRRIEILGMRLQTVLLHVGAGALTVVCDGQVEDQAPAAHLIAQVVADFHVCAALACACRYVVLRADRVSGRAFLLPLLDNRKSGQTSLTFSALKLLPALHTSK